MSKQLEYQVNEIMKLTQKVKNETEYQNHIEYKKFKARNKKPLKVFRYLANALFAAKFHEECIYWSNILFQDLKVSDKEDRFTVFCMINFSYFNLNNYEKTLEYAQKCLDLGLKKPFSQIVDLYDVMRVSASRLERFSEASKYAKEMLKIHVTKYNEKQITKHELLITYFNRIDLQIREGDINGARKTFRHLKIFNLNTSDPKGKHLS